MAMLHRAHVSWVVCVHAVLLFDASPTTTAFDAPHFVFVMVDDLGWNGFGFNENNNEVQSPTIDGLAKHGIVLTNHYVYKFCSPTRASFLTGRIPGHGIQESNLGFTTAVGCNLNLTMIGKKLKDSGYSTHLIGKWHQGFFNDSYTPHGRGFDTSFGFLGGGADHLSQCHGCENAIPSPDYATEKFSCPAKYSPCNIICPDQGGIDLFCTDKPCYGRNTTSDPYLYIDEATKIIRNASATSSRLFLNLMLHMVHQPVESPPEFVDLYPSSDYNTSNYARRVYNGMHSAADYIVLNVTKELEVAGLWNNTIFVLSTDNGGTAEHPAPVKGSSNYPLRGHKYSWFEGGVRAASFVASPLLPDVVRGTRNDGLFHISDWWATFSVLAGLPPQDNCEGCVPLDGLNIWDELTNPGAPPTRTELLLGVTAGAYRNGSYKLIAAPNGADGYSAQYPGTSPTEPAPTGPGCQAKGKPYCLFNIKEDPRETVDLFSTEPELGQQLYSRYQELAKNLSAPNSVDALPDDPLRCDNDLCWELEDRFEVVKHPRSSCNISGEWYLNSEDRFSFTNIDSNQSQFNMSVQGCANCAFTRGTASLKGSYVDVVAFGKGIWIEEQGELISDCNRIHWVGRNVTGFGYWSDLCRTAPCQSPGPNPAPPNTKMACDKMLETGYWAPYL